VAFGVLAKVVGAGTIFIALPLIAKSLPLQEYATFMFLLGAGSGISLVYGAIGAVVTRRLASTAFSPDVANQENLVSWSASLYLAVSLVVAVIATFTAFASGADALTALVLAIAVSTGLASWGEARRLADRSDYVTSLWQTAATLVMIVALVLVAKYGLPAIALVYFATPLAAHLGSTATLMMTRTKKLRLVTPVLGIDDIKGFSSGTLNSGIEYAKIFGSGFILSVFVDDVAFATYTTLVLMVARLVNPVSLLVRPLLPAYLDASLSGDQRWLGRFGLILKFAAAASLLSCIGLSWAIDPASVGWALPRNSGGIDDLQLVLAAVFLWGQTFTTLMGPVFFATRRELTFVGVNGAATVVGVGIGAAGIPAFGATSMLTGVSLAAASAALLLIGLGRPRGPAASAARRTDFAG
jgi:hypothetical protein